MSITISVLPETEEKLRRQAEISGQDLSQYASELVEKVVLEQDRQRRAEDATSDISKRQAAWNGFVSTMREHSKTLPANHVIDDSRESIYAGRGE